jgi:hypothetical protein
VNDEANRPTPANTIRSKHIRILILRIRKVEYVAWAGRIGPRHPLQHRNIIRSIQKKSDKNSNTTKMTKQTKEEDSTAASNAGGGHRQQRHHRPSGAGAGWNRFYAALLVTGALIAFFVQENPLLFGTIVSWKMKTSSNDAASLHSSSSSSKFRVYTAHPVLDARNWEMI